MKLALVSALFGLAAAQIPNRKPTYVLNQSTIVMRASIAHQFSVQSCGPNRNLVRRVLLSPALALSLSFPSAACNYTGFTNPATMSQWAVQDFDCEFFAMRWSRTWL
jgi:hypothetical protein